MLILYDYELSADAYKARLFMSLLGVDYEKRPVDVFPGREHQSDDFLEMNPLGTVPTLLDGPLVLGQAEAILCHLATTRDESRSWLPALAPMQSQALAWLFFAAHQLAAADAARLEEMLQIPPAVVDPARKAQAAFRVLEQRVAEQAFIGCGYLVGDRPTIADLACFPGVILSVDFGVGLEDYPCLRNWTRRIRSLPGFIPMPGIPEFL